MAGDVGEAEIAAGVAIGDALVVEAEQVQDRRVVIVNVARIGDDLHAVLVGLTVGDAAADAAAAEERAEGVDVVFASLAIEGGRGAAEFGADGHQRVVQQSALFEIGQQAGQGAVDALGLGTMGLHVAVGIPVVLRASVDEFDDAHASFEQSSGEETLGCEGAAISGRSAVERECGGGFAGQIERFGRGAHHAAGRLKAGLASGQIEVVGAVAGVKFVDVAEHLGFELGQRGILGAGCADREWVRHRE